MALGEGAGGGGANEAARALGRLGGRKGGRARAEKLGPEERSQIARRAVQARWELVKEDAGADVVRATHGGPGRSLCIGDLEIPCYVLENGRRVLSQKGMLRALGLSRGGGGDRLGKFLAGKAISPYLPKNWQGGMQVIRFLPPEGRPGGGIGYAYDAAFLVDICEAVLKARDESRLNTVQLPIAERCDILMRAFARVGIVALIDEATGYQAERDKDELHKILELYIAKELLPWSKRFPDEFYEHMFRLQGWAYPPKSSKKPKLVGALTEKLVYKRLPPGVLEELRTRNPVAYKGGTRKQRHHQLLSERIGNPHLEKQVVAVTTLMRVSDDWEQFQDLFEKTIPNKKIQGRLDLKGGSPEASAAPDQPGGG